ncbi:MAG: hypothetical protein U0350_48710 [Caldilineaceae bacterium]
MLDFVEALVRDLHVRPTTQRLVMHLILDLPLTPAVITDFGATSANHYRALKDILLNDSEDAGDAHPEDEQANAQGLRALRERICELDQALGNGAQLNALVRKYAPAYADRVSFWTSWDELYGRTPDECAQEG